MYIYYNIYMPICVGVGAEVARRVVALRVLGSEQVGRFKQLASRDSDVSGVSICAFVLVTRRARQYLCFCASKLDFSSSSLAVILPNFLLI